MLRNRELKKCIHSLLIHRLRSFLSTLGILFGVASVISMLSIGEGAKQDTLEQIQQLGMNSIIVRQHLKSDDQKDQNFEHYSKGITKKDVEALQQNIPHLVYAAPLKVVKASLTGASPLFSPEILAVTRHYGDIKDLSLADGRFLCDLDQKNNRLVCVLGYEMAKDLGKNGRIGETIRIENIYYEIVGILNPTYWKPSKNQAIAARNLDKSILIPLDLDMTGPNFHQSPKDGLSEIILQIHDASQMKITAQLVKHLLGRLHGNYEDYQMIIPQELLLQAHQTQQTFNWVLGGIAAISLLVGGVGIMNIMLANVSERTREIGIRRALGANKNHIIQQFLLETLLLSLGGAIFGVIAGVGISLTISYIANWKTIVTFWSVILSLGMSLMTGLCSGLYPAFQAAEMDPIKALRHE